MTIFNRWRAECRVMTDQRTRELIAALTAADAVRFGEFELSHGGTSDYYVDKYRFETDPKALRLIAEAFADQLRGTDATLAGVALGAVPLTAATALELERSYVIARKQQKGYGTGNRIEGELAGEDEVIVLEDIATTGQSAVDAVEALREAGATVTRALVVVDREEGATELLKKHDIRLESLVTASQLLAQN